MMMALMMRVLRRHCLESQGGEVEANAVCFGFTLRPLTIGGCPLAVGIVGVGTIVIVSVGIVGMVPRVC